jgi:Enoyl-[acyl-carrier-protein] reductase (NADH)
MKNAIILLLAVVSVAVAFLWLFVCITEHSQLSMPPESIVITFIGVLATFVVVGNYAQVKTVEKKFEDSVEKNKRLEKKFEDSIKENKSYLIKYSEISRSSTIAQVFNNLGQYDNAFDFMAECVADSLDDEDGRFKEVALEGFFTMYNLITEHPDKMDVSSMKAHLDLFGQLDLDDLYYKKLIKSMKLLISNRENANEDKTKTNRRNFKED